MYLRMLLPMNNQLPNRRKPADAKKGDMMWHYTIHSELITHQKADLWKYPGAGCEHSFSCSSWGDWWRIFCYRSLMVLWIHPAVVGFLLQAVVPLIHFMAFLEGVDWLWRLLLKPFTSPSLTDWTAYWRKRVQSVGLNWLMKFSSPNPSFPWRPSPNVYSSPLSVEQGEDKCIKHRLKVFYPGWSRFAFNTFYKQQNPWFLFNSLFKCT